MTSKAPRVFLLAGRVVLSRCARLDTKSQWSLHGSACLPGALYSRVAHGVRAEDTEHSIEFS